MDKGIAILFIEDEKNVRDTVEELLQLAGFDVTSAENGKVGLDRLRKKHFDIVVTDIMMPEMDGFELLKEIRKRPDTELMPVIFLTARVGLEDKLNGLECGANDYVTKPFEIKELIVRVQNLVQERRKLVKKALTEPDMVVIDSEDNIFLRKMKLVLEDYIAIAEFDVNMLADALHISRSTLQKKVKQITDKSVTAFVREYRLKRANALIIAGYGNISEVARKTGFNSVSYFSTSFKEYYGTAPTKLN